MYKSEFDALREQLGTIVYITEDFLSYTEDKNTDKDIYEAYQQVGDKLFNLPFLVQYVEYSDDDEPQVTYLEIEAESPGVNPYDSTTYTFYFYAFTSPWKYLRFTNTKVKKDKCEWCNGNKYWQGIGPKYWCEHCTNHSPNTPYTG